MNARILAAGGCLGLVALGGLAPVAPAYAAPVQCTVDVGVERVAPTTSESLTNARLNLEAAHELTRGAGVTVAVLDSGVAPVGGITLAGPPIQAAGGSAILSGHGTLVAGLVAGDEGIAPGARILPVKVFDKDGAEPPEVGLTSAGVKAGVDRLIERHRTDPFQVAVVPVTLSGNDPKLAASVERLRGLGVIVVASSGDRSASSSDDERFTGTPGSDAQVFPADYPGVVGVSATAPSDFDLRSYVLPNRDTDVAAPTVGAISWMSNGQKCDIAEPSSAWAAGQVAGVLALLVAQYPDEQPDQVVARLVRTAEGADLAAAGEQRDPWRGAGVVQPFDALTRELEPTRSGQTRRTDAQARADATAPPPPPVIDLYGESRTMLVWVALGGGALIGLALLLRPLFRR